jgi:3-isopropylmalate dehydrogenase
MLPDRRFQKILSIRSSTVKPPRKSSPRLNRIFILPPQMTLQTFNVAALAGDGIGPEVMREAIKVLRAVEGKFPVQFNITEAPVGWAGIDAAGKALPDPTLALCKQSDAILFGSVGLPDRDPTVTKDERPERAALLRLRREFELFVNLRPVMLWKELAHACPIVPERHGAGIDILVVRELTGGLYFGPKSAEILDNGQRRATDTMVYTSSEVERVAHFAFRAAQDRAKSNLRSKPRVTSIDKANVLENGVLWREVVTSVGTQYPAVELDHMLVDNAAMQLMLKPSQFDVMLCENLFGDILSDEAAALAGSLGMVPSASLGSANSDRFFGLYEPAGGTAPDIAGKGLANPIAQILSAALMLQHSFKLPEAYHAIVNAVGKAIANGNRTGDIFNPHEPSAKKIGTTAMGDTIAAAVVNEPYF